MFNDILELAENKLLLLYIFCKINIPISNSHITQIVLENNLINYFSLQQFLSELIESGLISDIRKDRQHMLSITPKGRDALEFFNSRIPEKKREIIDNYIKKNIVRIKNDVEVSADYEQNLDIYNVSLRLQNDGEPIMELKFSVDSSERAKIICSLWKQDPEAFYGKIIELFE
ncbi:MAG: hypothetical protein K0R09_1873 [Clostridiales bacterium]|jgi:predicted transcriptional regulator|nr:hypothetical protein [Clostridiales bacterium]